MKLSLICLLMCVRALNGLSDAEFSCYDKFENHYLRSLMKNDDRSYKYGAIWPSEEYESPEWQAHDLCSLDKDCMGFRCNSRECSLGGYTDKWGLYEPGEEGYDNFVHYAAAYYESGEKYSYIKTPGCQVTLAAGSPLNVAPLEEELTCTFRQLCYIYFTVKDAEGNDKEIDSARICNIDSRKGREGQLIKCKKPVRNEDGQYKRQIGGRGWKRADFTRGEWVLVATDGEQEFISDPVNVTNLDS